MKRTATVVLDDNVGIKLRLAFYRGDPVWILEISYQSVSKCLENLLRESRKRQLQNARLIYETRLEQRWLRRQIAKLSSQKVAD